MLSLRSGPAGRKERLRHPSCRGSWPRINTRQRVMGASHPSFGLISAATSVPAAACALGGVRELDGSLGLLSRSPGAPLYTPGAVAEPLEQGCALVRGQLRPAVDVGEARLETARAAAAPARASRSRSRVS